MSIISQNMFLPTQSHNNNIIEAEAYLKDNKRGEKNDKFFKEKFPHLLCFSELHLQLKVRQRKRLATEIKKKKDFSSSF